MNNNENLEVNVQHTHQNEVVVHEYEVHSSEYNINNFVAGPSALLVKNTEIDSNINNNHTIISLRGVTNSSETVSEDILKTVLESWDLGQLYQRFLGNYH